MSSGFPTFRVAIIIASPRSAIGCSLPSGIPSTAETLPDGIGVAVWSTSWYTSGVGSSGWVVQANSKNQHQPEWMWATGRIIGLPFFHHCVGSSESSSRGFGKLKRKVITGRAILHLERAQLQLEDHPPPRCWVWFFIKGWRALSRIAQEDKANRAMQQHWSTW